MKRAPNGFGEPRDREPKSTLSRPRLAAETACPAFKPQKRPHFAGYSQETRKRRFAPRPAPRSSHRSRVAGVGLMRSLPAPSPVSSRLLHAKMQHSTSQYDDLARVPRASSEIGFHAGKVVIERLLPMRKGRSEQFCSDLAPSTRLVCSTSRHPHPRAPSGCRSTAFPLMTPSVGCGRRWHFCEV
jgi:hypothetical protein